MDDERPTASFFSSASGLGFPSSSNFSGAIMRSSLIGKTLLRAPVSTLHWRLIFRFFSDWVISSVAKTSSCVSRALTKTWTVAPCVYTEPAELAPIVQNVDNAIHRINHYPVGRVVCFVNT